MKSGRIFMAIWAAGWITLISSCAIQPDKDSYQLTKSEKAICDSLKLDPSIIRDLRKYTAAEVEPFHYSRSKMYANNTVTELEPIRLTGVIFNETIDNNYDLIYRLKDSMKNRGYTIFCVELTGDSDNWRHSMGIVKGTDQYQLLKQMQTDGINYDITNDSLLTIIKGLDKKYQLELIGASGDYCEFIIHRPPVDWNQLAKEVYRVCPDVVDQGEGSVEALAKQIKQHRRLEFWWD